jgi:hypothetical protein
MHCDEVVYQSMVSSMLGHSCVFFQLAPLNVFLADKKLRILCQKSSLTRAAVPAAHQHKNNTGLKKMNRNGQLFNSG